MPPIALILYGRADCHLCDDMKAVVGPLAKEFGCTLEQIDISGAVDLERRFGQEIPVLFVNGRKAFKFRVTDAQLRWRLQTARHDA